MHRPCFLRAATEDRRYVSVSCHRAWFTLNHFFRLDLTEDESSQLKRLAVMHQCSCDAIMTTTITLTSRGSLTLPAAIRKELGLSPNDLMIAETTPEGILLRPAIATPLELYSEDRIREFESEEKKLEKVLKRKGR